MDKVDVILCHDAACKLKDLSYREFAEKLNLSVTAVHNRIQVLIDMGIIRKFTAAPKHFCPKCNSRPLLWKLKKPCNIRMLTPKLQSQGSIYWLAVGGGNILYVGAYFDNICELEPLVSFIKENCCRCLNPPWE